uniref:60S ribosomal protein L29 n=1 Tax=Fundulus heteroclitus TaxID=8078 RepID=A0A3Q2ULE1_FUNHE
MATSKNHTAHNQSRTWHRNGIEKPGSQHYENLGFATKHNKKGLIRRAFIREAAKRSAVTLEELH